MKHVQNMQKRLNMGTGKVNEKRLPLITEREDWIDQINRQLLAAEKPMLESGARCFQMGELRIILTPPVAPSPILSSVKAPPRKAHGYQLSIAHPHRLPTWAEMRAIADKLIPNHIPLVMPLPRKGDKTPDYTMLIMQADNQGEI